MYVLIEEEIHSNGLPLVGMVNGKTLNFKSDEEVRNVLKEDDMIQISLKNVPKNNHFPGIQPFNPFDQEIQKKIEESIKRENIEKNRINALMHHPESFVQVTMLYVDCLVNNVHVPGFVDSGAQTTIMSKQCAEKCHIMRLIDVRFAGIAQGVGTAKILGRIHSVQLQLGSLYLDSSITILDDDKMELLIGLDMLKRFQASIDLKQNALCINGEKIPFLGEADIPKSFMHQ